MKIAIDINGIFTTSGTGHYLRCLIPELLKIDNGNEYFFYTHFFKKESRPDIEIDHGKRRFIHFPAPEIITLLADMRFNLKLTEKFLLKKGIEVFHGPANLSPRFKKIKSVLTVHHYFSEKAPYAPKDSDWKERLYFKATDFSIKHSDVIVASSEYTKATITDNFGIDGDKIKVVHLGGPDKEYRVLKTAKTDIGFRIPEKFMMAIGPINERKNFLGLIRAFGIIAGKHYPHHLLIVGTGSSDYLKRMRFLAKKLGLNEKIHLTGHLGTKQICLLYNNADLLIYPSFHEGFGYPPLEAMACGCPVAASNATSIPEICGNAAIFFNPSDIPQMAASMERLINDERLRKELIKRGFERKSFFSWRKTAEGMIEAYSTALTGEK